jgi:signal transduction histidine kinase
MYVQSLFYVPCILGIFGIALFVWVRSKQIPFRLFSAFTAAFGLWLVLQYLTDSQIGDGKIWLQLVSVVTSFIAIIFVAFSYVYPHQSDLDRRRLAILSVPSLLLIPLSFTPFMVERVDYTSAGVEFTPGSLYGIASLILVGYFVFGCAILVRRLRGADRVYRQQLRALIAAILVAVIGNVLAGVVFVTSEIWQLARPVSMLGMVLIIAHAMVFHRLFDIRPAIARGAGYLMTISFLAVMYGLLVFGFAQIAFHEHFRLSLQVYFSLMTGVAALSFHFMRREFDKVTNRLFYQDAYDTEVLLNEYNKTLVSTVDVDMMLHRATAVVEQYMRPQFCVVGVHQDARSAWRIVGTCQLRIEPADATVVRVMVPHVHRQVIVTDELEQEYEHLQQILQDHDIDLLVRLTTDAHHIQEGLGFIALGRKKSGNPYTKQDIAVAETLANELVVALQNAIHFEEIERFNETLQAKVADATRELKSSNNKLRELNASKDDFIDMASHQLRTPLTSVKGYLSLVLDGDAGRITKTQRELLLQAFTSTEHMVHLVADLLNVSRLRTGKFAIERGTVDLCKVIDDEIHQLRMIAADRGITIDYRRPEHFPLLMLDAAKTRQVIMNYLDNAIYYTPQGGTVTMRLLDKPQSIEFRVTDSGIGVPRSEQHNLFSKFYRASNAQKIRPNGTGLGLFMAKKVIVTQGGAIIFDSKEGQGSTFGFSFPKTSTAVAPVSAEPAVSASPVSRG